MDFELLQQSGEASGSRWELLSREAAGKSEEVKVGQRRSILFGNFGEMALKGMQCCVSNYLEAMDRWQCELPLKDPKGKP
eukprot:3200332-Amphidinium_carterae.1